MCLQSWLFSLAIYRFRFSISNLFSPYLYIRRFPVVEKRWRSACKSENGESSGDELNSSASVYTFLPSDSELAAAFVERKHRLVSENVIAFFFCGFHI